jgi:hypothetical protein
MGKINFGEWVKSQLVQLDLKDYYLMVRTGLGEGAVNRWRKLNQTPRIDKFLIIDIDQVIQEALYSIPAYRAAKNREKIL